MINSSGSRPKRPQSTFSSGFKEEHSENILKISVRSGRLQSEKSRVTVYSPMIWIKSEEEEGMEEGREEGGKGGGKGGWL